MSMTDFSSQVAPRTDLTRPIRAGFVALVVLVGLLGGWSATTVIGGAIIARGKVAVIGSSKSLQHPEGGTVASISVSNGDRVTEGQVLLTLESTMVSASLDIAHRRLAAALAQNARLRAEHHNAGAVDFTLPDLPVGIDPATLPMDAEIRGQNAIFTARVDVLRGNRARLEETLIQLDDQIMGIRAQLATTGEQIALIAPQIASKQDLVDRGLARQRELHDLLTTRTDLSGRQSQLKAEIARLTTAKRQSVVETRQTEHGFREEVATRLSESEGQIEELVLEFLTRQNRLSQMEIRAPVTGTIHELQVTTIGGVVRPGSTLLEIVPRDSDVNIEVQIDPVSIDQVHPGQTAEVVFSAFNIQDTPRLTGVVRTVSAAAIEDPRTSRSFYRAEIEITPEEFNRLGQDQTPVPGMPVEAYLTTGDRTVLSYLISPFSTQLRRAFRD